MSSSGVFTVSLDFELYWGLRDKYGIEQCRERLHLVHQAIPLILDIFLRAGIHATWATVGFLFCKDGDDLRQNLPTTLPEYSNQALSPYRYLDETVISDPLCHFGPELIDRIRLVEGQEVATHTFSHYYCLENGQNENTFREDLIAAKRVAARQGIALHSLVFPRNQWNPDYLHLLNAVNIRCFRGNESSWLFRASKDDEQCTLRRALRLLDSYINLTGYHTYSLKSCVTQRPFNFPGSRFLRPYSRGGILESLRFHRISRAMDDAAQMKRIYHLWWHPHNFGSNLDKNIAFLSRIAKHFVALREDHGMQSLNMGELADCGEAND